MKIWKIVQESRQTLKKHVSHVDLVVVAVDGL